MYNNLKAEIARAGLSNQQLADTVGMHYNTLYRLLTGQQDFKLCQMAAIQEVLEVLNSARYTLDYLFLEGDEDAEGQYDRGTHDGAL